MDAVTTACSQKRALGLLELTDSATLGVFNHT